MVCDLINNYFFVYNFSLLKLYSNRLLVSKLEKSYISYELSVKHDDRTYLYRYLHFRCANRGGIPRGFTVLVAGNPGTGKTILTTHFLYDGLLRGEAAVYVSFSESKNQFYENFNRFGMKFADFEKDNKFAYLDFASITKEGISDALEEVLSVSKILVPEEWLLILFLLYY